MPLPNKQWRLLPRKHPELLSHLTFLRDFGPDDINPPFPTWREIVALTGLDPEKVDQAVAVLREGIKRGQMIVIHGDYDADGITATALLYETIYFILGYKNIVPFLPARVTQGYGITSASVATIAEKYSGALVIALDCGIRAGKVLRSTRARQLGPWILGDHHLESSDPEDYPPTGVHVIHTKKLTAVGIAWLMSEKLLEDSGREVGSLSALELVALGTLADVHPLVNASRRLVFYGLKALQQSKRLGLQALFKLSGTDLKALTASQVTWRITPRINAAGRIGDPMDALRLLLTKDPVRAFELARQLNEWNQARQVMTEEALDMARSQIENNLLVVVVKGSWHESISGLVAGRLAEELHRPVIAFANTGEILKGSGRSPLEPEKYSLVHSLEGQSHLLERYGGHSGAAGMTVAADQLSALIEGLNDHARGVLSPEDLVPILQIDGEVQVEELSLPLVRSLEFLSPFGEGNREPLFLIKRIAVDRREIVGEKHLKLYLKGAGKFWEALWWRRADLIYEIPPVVDLVFRLVISSWNGKERVQLTVEDLQASC